MMRFSTAVARTLSAVLLVTYACWGSAQQAYPSKPIRIISPYPVGGGTGILARVVGQKMSENWGQQVLVDNRGGGNTVIGTEAVSRAAPDGYTLLVPTGFHVISSHLISTLSYDPIKDFAPVATLASYENILVAHPSVPANDLQALIALAKAEPGRLNYGSAGSGGSGHLTFELLKITTGISVQHIPYNGSGPALNDVIGGQIQLFVNAPTASVPHVKSGKLKAIAITGETRLPVLPQVPTFSESGLPGFNAMGWYAILAPAGTPKAIVDKLAGEIARILALPDIREMIVRQGLEPFISTPEQFGALMKADFAKWGKVIKTANIKLER